MWIMAKRDNLIIIGGGILQHKTFIDRPVGLGTILVDGSPNCYCAQSPYFNNDYFVKASTRKPEEVIREVKKFLKKDRAIRAVGVYTQGTDAEYTVACLADALGLPGIKPEVAFACNNKLKMHQRFEFHGIPHAKYRISTNIVEAKIKAEQLGFPVVFKSLDNCASRGLTIVRKESEIPMAFYNALEYSLDKRVLLEEFLDGDEYSIDTVMYKGKLYPAGISDRVFTQKDNFAVQDGSLTPSLLPVETQWQMYQIMEDAAQALGVDNGAFKGDLVIYKKQVKILEVTARLSGGFDAQYRKPYSFGINLIKATIDIAMGKPLDFKDIIPQWVKYSQTFTTFPKPGVVRAIRGLDEIKAMPEVKQVFMIVKVGDAVSDYRHCANRVVHIVAVADTYEKLVEAKKRVLDTLQIITE